MRNSSVLPDNLPKLTGKAQALINFSRNYIATVISYLNPNKVRVFHAQYTNGKTSPKFNLQTTIESFNDCLNEDKRHKVFFTVYIDK